MFGKDPNIVWRVEFMSQYSQYIFNIKYIFVPYSPSVMTLTASPLSKDVGTGQSSSMYVLTTFTQSCSDLISDLSAKIFPFPMCLPCQVIVRGALSYFFEGPKGSSRCST